MLDEPADLPEGAVAEVHLIDSSQESASGKSLAPLLALAGQFESDYQDVSEHKQKHLADIYGDLHDDR